MARIKQGIESLNLKSTIAITVNLFLIQTWKESPFLEDGQKLEHGADG